MCKTKDNVCHFFWVNPYQKFCYIETYFDTCHWMLYLHPLHVFGMLFDVELLICLVPSQISQQEVIMQHTGPQSHQHISAAGRNQRPKAAHHYQLQWEIIMDTIKNSAAQHDDQNQTLLFSASCFYKSCQRPLLGLAKQTKVAVTRRLTDD